MPAVNRSPQPSSACRKKHRSVEDAGPCRVAATGRLSASSPEAFDAIPGAPSQPTSPLTCMLGCRDSWGPKRDGKLNRLLWPFRGTHASSVAAELDTPPDHTSVPNICAPAILIRSTGDAVLMDLCTEPGCDTADGVSRRARCDYGKRLVKCGMSPAVWGPNRSTLHCGEGC